MIDENIELKRICRLFVFHLDRLCCQIKPRYKSIKKAKEVYDRIKMINPSIDVIKIFRISEEDFKEEYGSMLRIIFDDIPVKNIWSIIFRRKHNDRRTMEENE